MFFHVMSVVLVHRVVNSMTYYTLMLNVSNMEGNPFMNFFWQSLVELPGYVVGKYLSDRFGRRWTQAVLFLALILAVVVVICIVGRKYRVREGGSYRRIGEHREG
jgi:sugar phosphate permease